MNTIFTRNLLPGLVSASLFLVLTGTSTHGQITHQQSTATANTSATTIQVTIMPRAAGDVILVSGASASSSSVLSISDSHARAWTVVNPQTTISGVAAAESWCAVVDNTTSMTITLGATVLQWMGILLDEVSGTTCTVDAHKETTGTGNAATTNVATSQPNEFWWGSSFDSITGVSSGWTKGADDTMQDWSEWQIVSATSTTAHAAFTGSGQYVAFFAAFPASGAVIPPPPVSVAVSPSNTSVQAPGGQTQFTATVQNCGSNCGVNWSVTSGTGSVSSTGLFTAGTVGETDIVQAQAKADLTKTATASVAVLPPVATGPVITSGSITIQLAADGPVTWAIGSGPGTVSASGLVTIPPATSETTTVVATSTQDTTRSTVKTISISTH